MAPHLVPPTRQIRADRARASNGPVLVGVLPKEGWMAVERHDRATGTEPSAAGRTPEAARRSTLRRGLVAGGVALAATLSRWSAEPAAALDPNDVVLGGTNPGSGTVATTTSINANVAAPGLSVNNSNVLDTGGAIQATAALSFGISARSGPGAALQFRNTGVIGAASGAVLPSDTSDNRGVYGSASNVGVHGYSATGTGVRGETASTNSAVSGVVGSAVRGPAV